MEPTVTCECRYYRQVSGDYDAFVDAPSGNNDANLKGAFCTVQGALPTLHPSS